MLVPPNFMFFFGARPFGQVSKSISSHFNGFAGLEGDPGSLEELWTELLAHWIAVGWLADRLAGGGRCWLGDRLATGIP